MSCHGLALTGGTPEHGNDQHYEQVKLNTSLRSLCGTVPYAFHNVVD